MVKKKKMHRLCAALFAVALLFVSLAPVLSIGADAAVIEVERDDNYELLSPDLLKIALPLDIFYTEECGLIVENPLQFVAYDGAYGFNQNFSISMPQLDASDNFFGTPLGSWDFEYMGMESLGNSDHLVDFSAEIDAGRTINRFGFTNSAPFVTDTYYLDAFFQSFTLLAAPGYYVDAAVEVHCLYPQLEPGSGWELVPFIYSHTNELYNALDEYLPRSPLQTFSFENNLPDGVSDFDYVIVDKVYFSVSYYNPDDGDYDYSAFAQNLKLSMLYTDNRNFYTFSEFYEEYPSGVIIQNTPSANNPDQIFNLTNALKIAVGGFLSTEIVPGLSFGGMLSAVLGISLVVVFLKYFGG